MEAAIPSVKFLSDKRFQHFYDQDQIVAKEIANGIGWDGHVAWDIYQFYNAGAEWTDAPPIPIYWMHQLRDSWADKEHFHTGDGLVKELLNAMTKLLDIYMVMGCIPYYLRHLQKGMSSVQNIKNLCVCKDGALVVEWSFYVNSVKRDALKILSF